MPAGDLYLDSSSNLWFRDSANVARSVVGYHTTRGSGAYSSNQTGTTVGDIKVGHWGQADTSGRLLGLAVRAPAGWRYYPFIIPWTTVKPSGGIRVSGTVLQIYWNGAWRSNSG